MLVSIVSVVKWCEKMKLLLSRLLLTSLCARSSWSVSSGTPVTQTPDVSVMEGETVNITCCWTLDYERITVNWLKNQTNTKREIFILKNPSQGSLQKKTSNCSHLILTDVTREDSGRYICSLTVEVPLLLWVEGIGTVITVTARNNTTDNTAEGSHQKEVLIYVLRCLPILALIITFFCINTLGTRAQQHTPAAPGNKLTSARSIEGNQEEEERDERGNRSRK